MAIPRLYVPMLDPEDVIRHLGKQHEHWKAGRSAHALSNTWFSSTELPHSVRSLFDTNPTFKSAELIDAFLEREVDLGTAGRHSQTDLLAIVAVEDRLAVVAVEGKAGEPFGEYVREWLDESEGKDARLAALCSTLGMSADEARPVRYQLLHRAASAVYETRRYRSSLAVLLIQSFAQDDASFADFADFLRALGIKEKIARGILYGPVVCEGRSLYAGWIDEELPQRGKGQAYLDDLKAYADKLSASCDQIRKWCELRRQTKSA